MNQITFNRRCSLQSNIGNDSMTISMLNPDPESSATAKLLSGGGRRDSSVPQSASLISPIVPSMAPPLHAMPQVMTPKPGTAATESDSSGATTNTAHTNSSEGLNIDAANSPPTLLVTGGDDDSGASPMDDGSHSRWRSPFQMSGPEAAFGGGGGLSPKSTATFSPGSAANAMVNQLFVGSLHDALALPEEDAPVQLVVTCLPERSPELDEALDNAGIEHIYFHIDDTFAEASNFSLQNPALVKVLDTMAAALLEPSSAGKGMVFVHCEAGITRSPSLIAMFMIARMRLRYYEAVRTVQTCRPQCRLRIFDSQLRRASFQAFGEESPAIGSMSALTAQLDASFTPCDLNLDMALPSGQRRRSSNMSTIVLLNPNNNENATAANSTAEGQ